MGERLKAAKPFDLCRSFQYIFHEQNVLMRVPIIDEIIIHTRLAQMESKENDQLALKKKIVVNRQPIFLGGISFPGTFVGPCRNTN